MAILGINCATEHLSLAVLNDSGKVTEHSWNGQTIKAENLLAYIDEVLTKANLKLTDIAKIGIASGPGAFTGLRLSLVTAKTIALAQQIPLIPISTLEALAHQYQAKAKGQTLRIVLDACRGDVSTALFDKDLVRLEEDHPVKAASIPQESTHITLINPTPDAATIAKLAQQSNLKFDHEQILALVPRYSHESRINYSDKPELQHLKIGKKP